MAPSWVGAVADGDGDACLTGKYENSNVKKINLFKKENIFTK